MKRFIEGVDRSQITLFPDRLEDHVAEDNAVRVVDVFVDELDLGGLGFVRVAPRATGDAANYRFRRDLACACATSPRPPRQERTRRQPLAESRPRRPGR